MTYHFDTFTKEDLKRIIVDNGGVQLLLAYLSDNDSHRRDYQVSIEIDGVDLEIDRVIDLGDVDLGCMFQEFLEEHELDVDKYEGSHELPDEMQAKYEKWEAEYLAVEEENHLDNVVEREYKKVEMAAERLYEARMWAENNPASLSM